MQYMGGKTRIAKALAEIIRAERPGRPTYVEPFVGGASVLTQVARDFETVYAFDAHPDLILMYAAIQEGWEPPEVVTEEEYADLRHAEPSPLRAFAGFGASFGGKWWGGYARNSRGDNYARATRNSLKKSAKAGAFDPHVHFLQADALEILTSDVLLEMAPETVIYCDPPYANTTTYTGVSQFDHDGFWEACRYAADAGAVVFVSEYGEAPEKAKAYPVWEGRPQASLAKASSDTTREVLYRLEGAS